MSDQLNYLAAKDPRGAVSLSLRDTTTARIDAIVDKLNATGLSTNRSRVADHLLTERLDQLTNA